MRQLVPERVERVDQAKQSQPRWMQPMRQVCIVLAMPCARVSTSPVSFLISLRSARPQQLELHRQHRHLLAHVVMDLSRDS
jgi:hypothetical protein